MDGDKLSDGFVGMGESRGGHVLRAKSEVRRIRKEPLWGAGGAFPLSATPQKRPSREGTGREGAGPNQQTLTARATLEHIPEPKGGGRN